MKLSLENLRLEILAQRVRRAINMWTKSKCLLEGVTESRQNVSLFSKFAIKTNVSQLSIISGNSVSAAIFSSLVRPHLTPR